MEKSMGKINGFKYNAGMTDREFEKYQARMILILLLAGSLIWILVVTALVDMLSWLDWEELFKWLS